MEGPKSAETALSAPLRNLYVNRGLPGPFRGLLRLATRP